MGDMRSELFNILRVFLRLGCTSFGGPVAHLGYFREEFVEKRHWLTEEEYADLVALCQALPGPASSQVGLGVGWRRGGYAGALVAWLGFTLPSALFMGFCAAGFLRWGSLDSLQPWVHGMKLAAAAVVAQAVWAMGKGLCQQASTRALALVGAVVALMVPGFAGQILVLLGGGLSGWLLFRQEASLVPVKPESHPTSRSGVGWTWVLGVLLIVVFLGGIGLGESLGQAWAVFVAHLRAGALVFGGGHVVLPLLQDAVVGPCWVPEDDFLAGYGLAQMVPGPLFTFSAFLGTRAMEQAPLLGGVVALVGIFLPSFPLLFCILPHWMRLRSVTGVQHILKGVNASVVGLLLAAFWDPVWTSSVQGRADVALALLAFTALGIWKCPPWVVVPLGALAGGMGLGSA